MPEDNLETKVEKLTVSVEHLTTVARENSENSVRDRNLINNQRKTLRILTFGVAALFVLSVIVVFIAVQNRHANAQVHDCITPSGACFKREAAQQAAIVTSISYRSEYERLTTEIQVSGAKGDQVAVNERIARRNEVVALLDSSNAIVSDIQLGIDPEKDPRARKALVAPQAVPVP